MMKISKRLLFTSAELIKYLKTVKKFNKLEEEVLATITYKYAYQKLNGKYVLIGFPYKENKEREISNRPLLKAQDIGQFLKKYVEENSAIDSMLVDPKDEKTSIVRPIQIKFLGKGKYSPVTTDNFIEFLKEHSQYQKSKISLIIPLQDSFRIRVEDIAVWLENNPFPFEEVVLIRPDSQTGDMEFYQLKPCKAHIPLRLVMTREEMFRER